MTTKDKITFKVPKKHYFLEQFVVDGKVISERIIKKTFKSNNYDGQVEELQHKKEKLKWENNSIECVFDEGKFWVKHNIYPHVIFNGQVIPPETWIKILKTEDIIGDNKILK